MTPFLDLAVFFYVAAALLWELPLAGRVLAPFTRLLEWAGFEQHWGMFAPDPPTSDRDLAVLLELPQGGALAWEPPRLHELSAYRAFLAFRYRSFEHALLYGEGFPGAHAALGDYLLRTHATAAGGPPRAAVFVSLDRPIASPNGTPMDAPLTRASLFTHRPDGASPE